MHNQPKKKAELRRRMVLTASTASSASPSSPGVLRRDCSKKRLCNAKQDQPWIELLILEGRIVQNRFCLTAVPAQAVSSAAARRRSGCRSGPCATEPQDEQTKEKRKGCLENLECSQHCDGIEVSKRLAQLPPQACTSEVSVRQVDTHGTSVNCTDRSRWPGGR